MAFQSFADAKVDLALIETGLGGRLDATNVITPLVAVLTNIDKDHTDRLGKSLASIAGEKAGIIKPGVPVVIGKVKESVGQAIV
jgi:dihydrofolate synthase/folylpolyglutamate synthase